MNEIIAISHDPGDAHDRCSVWLEAAGYDVVSICPAAGDAIPQIDSSIAGAVIFGGKYDVGQQSQYPFLVDELRFIDEILKRQLPYLGICLGGQLLAHALGETVDSHPQQFAEYGYYHLFPAPEGRDFVGGGLKVLQSHWHGWYATPQGATRLAYSENFPEQAFRYGGNAYAMQFHPEATRGMLEKWIGRRPPERYRLRGSFAPERQLADFLEYDAALGSWFHGFLSRWIGRSRNLKEAAE